MSDPEAQPSDTGSQRRAAFNEDWAATILGLALLGLVLAGVIPAGLVP